MTKILNLDKLVEASKLKQRELVIGGKNYPIPEMTVQNFIETTRAAAELQKHDDVASQVEATIDLITRSVPGIPREVLTGYSIGVLGDIANFVRGDDVDAAEEVGQAGEAGN